MRLVSTSEEDSSTPQGATYTPRQSAHNMSNHGDDNKVRFYFMGEEYFNLLCDMAKPRNLITNTEMVQRSADKQEELDAAVVHLGTRIELDLSAIRVNLDHHFRQMPRSTHWSSTPYTDVNNCEPLECGADGPVIHDLNLIERSRKEKVGRSPEAQYALRIGYQEAFGHVCALWIIASPAALFFGSYASHAK
jgi:hypothetical protein